MRRFLICVAVILACVLNWNWAAEAVSSRPLIILDGEVIVSTVPPMVLDGTTLVPFRAISEITGATVDWEGQTQTATARKGDMTASLVIGEKEAKVDGNARQLPIAPRLENGTTMVPLRFLAETFGLKVDWDDRYHLVILESKVGANTDLLAAIRKRQPDDQLLNILGTPLIRKRDGQLCSVVSIQSSEWSGTKVKVKEANGDSEWQHYYGNGAILGYLRFEDYVRYLSLKDKTVWVKLPGFLLQPDGVHNLQPVVVRDVKVDPVLWFFTVTVETDGKLLDFSIPGDRYTRNEVVQRPEPIEKFFLLEAPRQIYQGWSDWVWSAIEGEQVFVGMTKDQAILAWGNPKDINTTTTSFGTTEQWVYGLGTYLYFDDGILSAIQN